MSIFLWLFEKFLQMWGETIFPVKNRMKLQKVSGNITKKIGKVVLEFEKIFESSIFCYSLSIFYLISIRWGFNAFFFFCSSFGFATPQPDVHIQMGWSWRRKSIGLTFFFWKKRCLVWNSQKQDWWNIIGKFLFIFYALEIWIKKFLKLRILILRNFYWSA